MNSYQLIKKRNRTRAKKSESESMQLFWAAPMESRFGEDIIAVVVQKSVKTLQCERWRKSGILFSKVAGRVLYKKEHVVAWLESFGVCDNTSQYQQKEEPI